MRKLALIIALALLPTSAYAHPDPSHALGFLHGFAHPLGGGDHILAMLAVGVFAAVLSGRALWLMPLSFLAMMVAGFVLGVSGITLPLTEPAVGISGVVILAAAMFGRSTPVSLATSLVGVFALFHGMAHGAEMPVEGAAALYAAGFVAATALLHAAGLTLTLGVAWSVRQLRKAMG
jgi:urease accessory protein